jgi:hypothetical protein
MGCFHSIQSSLSPNRPCVTKAKSPPKVFDSDSTSCQSLSSPGTSIGPKSPIISIEPPSPFKPLYGFETAKKEPLDLPISEINNKIAASASSIQAYEIETKEHRERLISDLESILELISENSLAYTKIEILRSHISSLYREKHFVTRDHFTPAAEKLPARWKEFLGLDEAEQRAMARTQRRSSCLMRMFTFLSCLRIACHKQRDLNLRIERKIGCQFNEILRDLKYIGEDEAALKWRVVGIVNGKRREEREARLDDILGFGIKVSGLLVGVVEALSEEE